MNRVFVLDTNKQELMPYHEVRTRILLAKGKAAIYKRYPFTIILKYAVGDMGKDVYISLKLNPLSIHATGRGSRQMCRMDKYGFPRTSAKKQKRVHEFQTGYIVKAIVPKGKKAGEYVGRVLIRSSGSFDIVTKTGKVQGIGYRHFSLLQRVDGYNYNFKNKGGKDRRLLF